MSQYSTIDGTVLNLIFQNEENGYTVLRLVTTDGEVVTVVGCIPCAAPGESMIVEGRWMTHPTHGEQVQAERVERHLPDTEAEIQAYLGSGVVKGVGPATAERIVACFGAQTLTVLEEDPEGRGDPRELRLPHGDAAADGLSQPQRPAFDPGPSPLPPLRGESLGGGEEKPLPPGG